MLNGIVVVNKPRGVTSSDCVYKLRKILHIRKIGHAGTLDPEVNGVLPIAVGQATKLIELMHEKPKSYIGSGMFGRATDSYDLDGKTTAEEEIVTPFTSNEIIVGMKELTGKLEQVPPIYSAVRVNGKRLYEYAREHIPVERPKRKVNVYSYELTQDPEYDPLEKTESFNFAIHCSKGTYVRSLVNDLGEKLGVPAVMTSLTRTSSSGFDISQAVDLETIEAEIDTPEKWLQSIDSFFVDLPKIKLSPDQFKRVSNGAGIDLNTNYAKVALVYNGCIKAIYQRKGKIYRPEMMLLKNE
ncbi:tRNA pseudouridine(55) synthase TruB [Lactobacillus taiwanensis]|jgi:tRNA pseudouridine 55 synthase|uniref:tRNA pseudouridine(55) synthase TruB n=1 Tax=Lactobacillus taiwanensis TaxID=508451 RepID=UPI000B987C4F|nr:tRNA pseudouridine(55) synthase TruB [Lactobacillus taiwanensis]OYS18005.1 tRNA pseudouridine(55) synthase TruB [Lactobacillus taiwanensis]OYS18199.1 tRNA pseudouridine(55) synthase TruB [Lactobacillus taiwanensis]